MSQHTSNVTSSFDYGDNVVASGREVFRHFTIYQLRRAQRQHNSAPFTIDGREFGKFVLVGNIAEVLKNTSDVLEITLQDDTGRIRARRAASEDESKKVDMSLDISDYFPYVRIIGRLSKSQNFLSISMDRVELVSGTFCPYQHTLRVIFEQLSIDKGFPPPEAYQEAENSAQGTRRALPPPSQPVILPEDISMNISFIGDDAPCQENFVARQDISMTELAEALPSARSKSMKARESDFMNEGMAPSNPPSPTVPRTPARSKVFFSTISPRRAATGFIKQTRNGRCEALLGESPPCVIPNESALLPAAVAPAPILANKSFSCGTPSKPSPSTPLAVHSDVSEAQEVPPAQGHAIVENDDPNVHSKPRRQRTPKRLSDVNPYSDLTPLQRDIILVILTLTEETLQTDRPRSIYPPINGEQPWKGVPAKPLVRTIQAKYPNLSEDEMVDALTFLLAAKYISNPSDTAHYIINSAPLNE